MAYDRTTFQLLAELRLTEAKLLAHAGHHSGAYYLAGYALECALKARIASQFRDNQIPDKVLVNRIYTHDLSELVRLAGLVLARRWSVAVSWSEQARYLVWTRDSASDMIEAVGGAEDQGGLLLWLTNRW